MLKSKVMMDYNYYYLLVKLLVKVRSRDNNNFPVVIMYNYIYT